jgi:hypothetical protein
MVRSEGYEIKRGAHFRGVPITRGSDLSFSSSAWYRQKLAGVGASETIHVIVIVWTSRVQF